jgi:hypothetical protein
MIKMLISAVRQIADLTFNEERLKLAKTCGVKVGE